MSKKSNKKIVLRKINRISCTQDAKLQAAPSQYSPSVPSLVAHTPPIQSMEDIIHSSNCEPESTLDRLWCILNKGLTSKEPDIKYLSSISSLMYKVSISCQRMHAIEIKKQEHCMKQEIHKMEMERMAMANKSKNPRNSQGLTEEEFRYIEQRLNLM